MKKQEPRKPVSKRMRFDVFKRDSFTCQYCGKSAPEVILHVDHINPVSKGGKNAVINLITACQDCNLGKSDKPLSDSTAAAKAKAQADILQERRNQLKMMADWYREIQAMRESEVDIVESSMSLPATLFLNDFGRRSIAGKIKRHGLTTVIQAVSEAFMDAPLNADQVQLCMEKMERILKWGSDPFHVQRAKYITGVIRNRFPKHWDWYESFKQLLAMVIENHPGEHHRFYKIAANSETISEARDEMAAEAQALGITFEKIKEAWNV